MEGQLLLALLGLCMGLGASVQDLNLDKFSGLWYEIAFASKLGMYNSSQEMENMAAVVVAAQEKHLALTMAYYNEDHCVVEKEMASQVDNLGKFMIPTAVGNKEVEIAATDYKTYAIMDISFHIAGKVQRVLKLYSRSLEYNEQSLRKFQEAALKRGFTNLDILLLKLDLTCVNKLEREVRQAPEGGADLEERLPRP